MKRRKATRASTGPLFRRLAAVERFPDEADAEEHARLQAADSKVTVVGDPRLERTLDGETGKEYWLVEFDVGR